MINLLEVEDAHIVSLTSAGIAQSMATVIGQKDVYHAYHIYTKKINKREIILPKGHNGHDRNSPVEVMVSQGGGKVVEASYANMSSSDHLEMMVTESTRTILCIKSHHTVKKSMLSVEKAMTVVKQNVLPRSDK